MSDSRSNGRQANSSPPPGTNPPWTPSRRPAGPPNAHVAGLSASRQVSGSGSSSTHTFGFSGRSRFARQSSGSYTNDNNSNALSPRSGTPSSMSWRSSSTPNSDNANAANTAGAGANVNVSSGFITSPIGTPHHGTPMGGFPAPAGAFHPPADTAASPTGNSFANTNSNSYNHNTNTTSSPSFTNHQHYHNANRFTATADPATAPVVQGPQVHLTADDASRLVCPWWLTYDRCGQRGCPFSHGKGTGLLEQPLICPYWARSPGTTGKGCKKGHEHCQFAHFLCEHGQKAPVPKPK
ncbi:hypothetical protein PG995_007011 [Apiospora arundinis]|uniref:Brasilane terpene glycosides biosynthesis cluster protein D n=1 Tax=Apiospora arundinis TaxID=335852 RepID=A0ABR2JHK7_9PEZI